MVELIEKKNVLSPTEQLLHNKIDKLEEEILWFKDDYYKREEQLNKDILFIIRKLKSLT